MRDLSLTFLTSLFKTRFMTSDEGINLSYTFFFKRYVRRAEMIKKMPLFSGLPLLQNILLNLLNIVRISDLGSPC
jgi:hypothetical protein